MKEYGIDAEFENIFQATILKQAVDSFTPLNYENKGKRLFEGLIVRNDEKLYEDEEYETFAVNSCTFLIDVPKEIKTSDYDTYITYISEHPECISYEDDKILINPKAEYDSAEYARVKSSNESSYRFFNGVLIHELGHWLHMKNSPADYYLSEYVEFTNDEKEIVKEVSNYVIEDTAEFIAEYIAGRLDGNKYSSKTDELYEYFGGPKIFKD